MLFMIASGGLLLFLDQWSKRMVQEHVGDRGVCCGPILRIRRVASRKKSYRHNGARTGLVVIWFAALVSAIVLHGSGGWFQSDVALVGLGLALGGAAGNLWDILRRHYVVDFIDLRWWPVFNLADVAIIAGLVVAFWRHN